MPPTGDGLEPQASGATAPTAEAKTVPVADLMVAAVLALVAAIAGAGLPEGSLLRAALTLPILLVIPGYLLIQTAGLPRLGQASATRLLLLSVGASPAVVGLLALAAWALPTGVTPAALIAVVATGCLLLSFVAGLRRERGATAPPSGQGP